MHNFVMHSNESVCRKSGYLGLEQVSNGIGGVGMGIGNMPLLLSY